MKYTDAEVDEVALAILNGLFPMANVPHVSYADRPGVYRSAARVALAARDALFDVVGETWAVRNKYGFELDQFGSKLRAEEVAASHSDPANKYHVVHVTTKRRKR